MGAVIFSDVHADAGALAAMRSCISDPHFTGQYGTIDYIVNLGDLLHRGDRPQETLEGVLDLSRSYRLISVMGNHDHAFLNGLSVSGSDAASLYRHEQLRGSPLLSFFDGMPMEWTENGMLFVHGGPMELGTSTLELKCWQRLGREPGDTFAGYNYTPGMAFSVLQKRNLRFLCCGHQHTSLCCRKLPQGIQHYWLDYTPADCNTRTRTCRHEVARVPLDAPAILRVGACFGQDPEFAYTDFKTFYFIRIL
jgi:predicted phosphodiesterase